MKIKFWGTSHGVPSAERYCQSMFIETEHGGYIVDAGAPVMEGLLKENYDLTKLKAVFITHMHGDHVAYIFGLLSLASWYYHDMDFDVYLPEQEGIDTITAFLKMTGCDFPNDRVRLHLIRDHEVYQDEELKVTAFPTKHLEDAGRPAYGYLLEADGKKVYISGDLNGEKIDYPDFLNEEAVDVLIIECAHFAAEKLIDKLHCCKAKQVWPIHVWTLDKYQIFQEAEKDFSFSMKYPEDGDQYEIGK